MASLLSNKKWIFHYIFLDNKYIMQPGSHFHGRSRYDYCISKIFFSIIFSDLRNIGKNWHIAQKYFNVGNVKAIFLKVAYLQ